MLLFLLNATKMCPKEQLIGQKQHSRALSGILLFPFNALIHEGQTLP